MKKHNPPTTSNTIRPQYILDQTGNKTAVILDIVTFENMVDALEDNYLAKAGAQILATENSYTDLDELRDMLSKRS